MPIYEYQCTNCGHHLEALQKISEPVLTQCPKCQGDTLTKLVSAAGFQLKGSGWYITDYSKKGQGKEKKEETKKTSSSTENKATVDTKPTTKETKAKEVKTKDKSSNHSSRTTT